MDDRPKRILDVLQKTFTLPKWKPSSEDPFKTLIVTIISQNTADRNTARAFENLSNKFRIIPEVLAKARASEGVDFPEDEMNSAVIVGVPYAEPTPKVKAQIRYFEECYPGHGREYGYVIPAMKKASQAAGRPIRTLDDRAAMIFLEYRFSTPYCQQFFPPWIQSNLKILPSEEGAISRELQHFFRRVS